MESYPSAVYKELRQGEWIIKPTNITPDGSKSKHDFIPWISIDPLNPDFERLKPQMYGYFASSVHYTNYFFLGILNTGKQELLK